MKILVKAILIWIFPRCGGTGAPNLLFLCKSLYKFCFFPVVLNFYSPALARNYQYRPFFSPRQALFRFLHWLTDMDSKQLLAGVDICGHHRCINVHRPQTFALRCSRTLSLSNPLCVLLSPHTIACVRLLRSCGESLSQLSLYGLKLPGQVYSAVSPCAAGPGSVESSWILSVSSTSSSVTLLTLLHHPMASHTLKYSRLQ